MNAASDQSQEVRYRYDAFLSYAHADKACVAWLHKLLTSYWIPGKRRRRVFMDQESLPAGGGLTARLKDALEEARFLIVCCSPHAAGSQWVDLEIREFLKTHPATEVLACVVGRTAERSTGIPPAIAEIERQLGDQLFKPDLSENPENLERSQARTKTREALSLLAPLVGMPGKDALLDRRKKTAIVTLGALLLAAISAGGWELWRNRPEAQIDRVVASSPVLVRAAALDSDELEPIQAWLRAMVLTGRYTEAIAAAGNIEQIEVRARALIFVFEELIAAGQRGPALPVADETLRLARSIAQSDVREGTLARLGEALTNAGMPERALGVAKEIEEPDERARAMIAIVAVLDRTGRAAEARQVADEAIEALRRSELPARNAASLAMAILVFGTADLSNETAAVTAMAMKILDEIEYAADRSRTRAFIIEALANAGRSADAAALSRRILDPAERCATVAPIVQAMATEGDKEGATRVVAEAMRSTSSLEDPDDRARARTELIAALATAGFIAEAMETARSIARPEDRSDALGRIVKALASRREPSQALQVAAGIDDPYERSWALVYVLEGFVDGRATAQAKKAAAEFLASSQGIESKADRSQLLSRAVETLSRAGLREEAGAAAMSSFAAARAMDESHDRALSLIRVVEVAAHAGLQQETRQFVPPAMEAARRIHWADSRTGAVKRIVVAVARTGLHTEAFQVASAVSDANDRAHALAAVAAESARRTGLWRQALQALQQAEESASQVTAAADKSAVVAEIAVALGKWGRYRRAREIVVANKLSSNDALRAYTAIVLGYCGEPCARKAETREGRRI